MSVTEISSKGPQPIIECVSLVPLTPMRYPLQALPIILIDKADGDVMMVSRCNLEWRVVGVIRPAMTFVELAVYLGGLKVEHMDTIYSVGDDIACIHLLQQYDVGLVPYFGRLFKLCMVPMDYTDPFSKAKEANKQSE